MRGLTYTVLQLLLLLFIVEPERAEKENPLDLRVREDGGDANHKVDTPAEKQHENGDGLNDSIDNKKQKDGPSVRLKLSKISLLFLAVSLGLLGIL